MSTSLLTWSCLAALPAFSSFTRTPRDACGDDIQRRTGCNFQWLQRDYVGYKVYTEPCTLIDNDTRHRSGQNAVNSRGAAEWVHSNIKDNEKNICQDLSTIWRHRLGPAICKLATNTRQTSLSKTFGNSLNMQKQYKKNVWEKSNDAYSLSVRVQTTINHISICFLPQYQHQRNLFFQSASWKGHCATHWREQRGMDSYQQRQISESDARLAAIVVKIKTSMSKKHRLHMANRQPHFGGIKT